MFGQKGMHTNMRKKKFLFILVKENRRIIIQSKFFAKCILSKKD